MEYYNDELMHYGVKGMKWGVRRRSDQPTFRQASKKARADGLEARKAARNSGQLNSIGAIRKGNKIQRDAAKTSLKEQKQAAKIVNVAKRLADPMGNISKDGPIPTKKPVGTITDGYKKTKLPVEVTSMRATTLVKDTKRIDKGKRIIQNILFPAKEKTNKNNNFEHIPSNKERVYEHNKRGRVPTAKERRERSKQNNI